MSKIKYFIVSAICLMVAIFMPLMAAGVKDSYFVAAETAISNKTSEQIAEEIKNELEAFVESGTVVDEKVRDFRIPGSKEEYNSAMYIHSVLSVLNNFEAVNDGSTVNGIQNFNFKSFIDGRNYTSQNIVFKRESSVQTNKKVILAAHYDSTYVYNEVRNTQTGEYEKVPVITDGVNDNAGGVALLLTIAKNLDQLSDDIGYDIEIVFFGASSNDYAGSVFYNKGKTSQDCKDILLMVNFDKAAVGKYTYAYVNEFETTQEEYMSEVLNTQGEFKHLNMLNTLDTDTASPNGLDYTHIGLEGDHAVFMERGVNVLSFLSGDYENPLTFGYSEFGTGENVTYTQNDNYSYILTNYPETFNKLASVYMGVNTLLWDNEFVAEMEKENVAVKAYEFWTNEKLAVFITAVLLIVFIAIYYMIYHNLLRKSKKSISDNEIDKIVIKITSNLGDSDQTINNIIDDKISDDVSGDDGEKK